MATCGDHSSSPAARGASGWHDGLSPGLPWPRAGARPSLQARAPACPARALAPASRRAPQGLSRAGAARLAREGGWPRGGLARAGGWRAWPARGAGTPGLARELAPAPTGLVLVETLLGPSWPPPSKTFKKNYLKLKFGTEAWKNPI